jgi:ketosteroid isomerase-like protein
LRRDPLPPSVHRSTPGQRVRNPSGVHSDCFIHNKSGEGGIMKPWAALLGVLVFASAAAIASDKSDAMAVVHQWVDAFNKGDGKTGAAQCADGAVILDDFAPHVWQGSGACATWYRDFEAFVAKAQISDPSVALARTHHLDVDAGYAYLVTPATLSYSKAGKAVAEKALVVMTLKKGASGWQITGWSWADQ